MSLINGTEEMIEIKPKLYIGDITDCRKTPEMNIVHACKEPCHRKAMGYPAGKSAPEGPGYYYIIKGHHLYLNLVDSPNPKFIPDEIIMPTLAIIHKSLKKGKPVLIHCNKGESRAPGLGLLYLIFCGDLSGSYEEAVKVFKVKYPKFSPSKGMKAYIQNFIERR